MMECSGVLSSWETFAVNSRRSCSARRLSVTSKASSTAPPPGTGLAVSWYSQAHAFYAGLRTASGAHTLQQRAQLRAAVHGQDVLVHAVLPAPKSFRAAGFMLRTRPSASRRMRPSDMLPVTASNSRLRRPSSSSWPDICRRCRSTRVSRGESSS